MFLQEKAKKGFSLRPAFNFVRDYGPATALVIGGGLVADGSLAMERYDLLLGGGTLSLLGAEIIDTVSGFNLISKKIPRLLFNREIEPGTVMGTTGLASVVFLGGGELAHMASHYNWNASRDVADMATEFIDDPAAYKVAANFTAYTAASVMDFPKVEKWASEHVSQKNYRLTQIGLTAVGAVLLYAFGAAGRITNARMFGHISGGASIYSFAAKYHEEELKQQVDPARYAGPLCPGPK